MSTASYPHVEISVRDDSIYTPIETENLPLNKPLYMMRAQKGPVGVPVWCDTYTKACRVFGEDTFNKRSPFFSEQAYFLLKTFPSNGAFIMRVCDTNAKSAVISIECGVSKNVVDVPQWKRDANGRFVLELDGSKIPINNEGEECQPVEGAEAVTVYARALETVAIDRSASGGYFLRKSNFVYNDVIPSTRVIANTMYFKGQGVPKFSLVVDSSFDSKALYFELNDVGGGEYTATPKFDLTAFASGKTYLKFVEFAGGFAQKTDLPEIAPGQTIGDKFLDISTEAIKVTESGDDYVGVEEASLTTQKYATYVFTRSLDSSNPYTYTSAGTIPVGTSLTDNVYYYKAGEYDPGTLEPQAVLSGRKIAWRAHVRSNYTARPVGTSTTEDSDNFTWYPMIDIAAENPGTWGGKFGVRLFFDIANNTVAGELANEGVTYTFAPVQLVGDDTTPTAITDAYGSTMITGVVKHGVLDASTDVDISLDKRIPNCYSGSYELPIATTWIGENWAKVGKILMNAEIASDTREKICKNGADGLYPNFRAIVNAEGDLVAETFVDALYEKLATADDIVEDDGYKANVISLVCGDEIPYFCSCVVDATDALVSGDTKIVDGTVIVPSAETAIYLGAGEDGDITDVAIERYIRAQITAAIGQTQEYLIDYARCPFNAIYDTGVSLATKKAYLDLLTVRDSLVVNLSTQSTWVKADGTTPAENGRYNDESIGSSLRAYAWLMREDVANGTEACRAKIFLHAGYTSDHEGPVASTLWIALKDAQYLCRKYIWQEPKELPNSDVGCWSKISWVAAAEETKARCWNAGLNYVQYYNMTHYHYASVRTVYRYETSVLVDAGVVNALTFMKDEVRRSWATWAGSTRPASELNAKIMEDLSARFAYLLNGKYQSTVSVYQTDEDKKLGYVRHVDIQLISPATNRVWLATIICKREGFNPEA